MTLKVRRHDFSTATRSATLPQPVDDDVVIAATARRLLALAPTDGGVRLLGVGVSGLSDFVQTELALGDEQPEPLPGALADDAADAADAAELQEAPEPTEAVTLYGPVADRRWRAGQDVHHDEQGDGWVWGSGRGLVTVRFEGPRTGPGPVRTFRADDPALRAADAPDWRDAVVPEDDADADLTRPPAPRP